MKRFRCIAFSCVLATVISLCAVPALAGVEVTSDKSGTQKTDSATSEKLSSFPYADRVKVNDLIRYVPTDFIEAKNKKWAPIASMDSKYNAPLQTLPGSNWYSSDSLSTFLMRVMPLSAVASSNTSNNSNADSGYEYDDNDYLNEADEAPLYDDQVDEPQEADSDDSSTTYTTHSTTNVQVQGVDEADIIKTDGRYIYYLSSKGIAIIDSNNGKPKQIASLKPNAQIGQNLPSYQDLYISGNTLVIIAQKNNVDIFYGLNAEQGNLPNSLYSTNTNTFSSFDFYDISNPESPKLKRQVNIQGSVDTTRLYNNTLYYVIEHTIYSQNTIVNLLPKYQDSLLGNEYYVILPKDIFMDIYGSSDTLNTFTIGGISLIDEKAISPKVYETNGYNDLYVNKDSLYLSTTARAYTSKNYPTAAKTTVKAEVPPLVDNSENAESSNRTLIAHFDLKKNSVDFKNMTSIWGTIANERFINTNSNSLSIVSYGVDKKRKSAMRLTILNSQTLVSEGESALFAENSMSSVRFIGNYVYVSEADGVTIFDLSDKGKIKKVGKVDTFTNAQYLHPYGQNYLIGIGIHIEDTYVKTQEEKDKQIGYRNGGVEFTLFDIRKLAQPKIVNQLVIGSNGSSTLATRNPKSLMFDAEKEIMMMPFVYNDLEIVDGKEKQETWNGGLVLEISDSGIKKGATFSLGDYYTSSDSRFVYIGDMLYYVTSPYLVAMDYNTYKIVNSLNLQYS